MRRTWKLFGVAMAVVLLAGATAFAAKPVPAPVPLSPTKIPQFQQPLDTLGNGGIPLVYDPNAPVTSSILSICEFQTTILPVGTPLTAAPPAGTVPGATWVWGYNVGDACPPRANLVNHSYLGPVVIADRGVPTQMTFVNRLPNVAASNVSAYTKSTDTTLIWGDPLSLNDVPPPITLFNPVIDQATGWFTHPPEDNLCYLAAQNFVAALGTPCGFNYGTTYADMTVPANQRTIVTYAAPVPAAVHIHGGEVPAFLDGGPDAWFTGNGIFGHGFYTRHVKDLPLLLAALPAKPVASLPALPADGYPVGTVVFNRGDSSYYVNFLDAVLGEIWAPTAAPYAVDTLVQGGGLAYLMGPAVMEGITAFPEGTLVYNEADAKNYQVTYLDPLFPAGKWALKTSVDRASYVYPNGQEAAPVWFHDHMLGATRLNVYAGIAGGYVIKEPASTLAPGLHPLGLSDAGTGALTELTVPLIIQDRMFDTAGQLFFPAAGINPEHPYWVPEFVGDVIVVNGKAWPFLEVAPKRYRFIFLNGSNARAYDLYLMSKTTGLKGPSLWVIGNDQGYLDAPQEVNPNLKPYDKLAMMPGERYEVIIDFAGLAGQTIEMRNTARTPYTAGAPVNGNTTGKIIQFRVTLPAPAADTSFNPGALPKPAILTTPMKRLVNVNLAAVPPTSAPAVTKIDKVRRLTLNEVIAAGGPLEILVNNTLYDGGKKAPRPDFHPITTLWDTTWYSELPHEGETELWEIVNLTADAHPMHPHLVAFQVLNRQGLDVLAYTAAYNQAYAAAQLPIDGAGPPLNYNSSGDPLCSTTPPARGAANYVATVDPVTGLITPQCILGGNPDPANLFGWMPGGAPATALLGAPLAPMPQEIGWKDTVQVLPNMVTRFLVRFAKADLPAATLPDDAGYDFSPNHGHGYVWHCHIVDHEDNEMMRPYTVWENALYPHDYVMGIDY